MEKGKVFKTKTGFCHVLPDKIVLSRDGVIGEVAKLTVGNNIARILILYGIATLGLFYFGYINYQKGKYLLTALYALVGLFLIYGILTSLNNSTESIIERSKIKDVKFKKAIKGLTRSRLELKFEDQNGKIKQRLIMLPGSLSNGESETDIALKILSEEGIIK